MRLTQRQQRHALGAGSVILWASMTSALIAELAGWLTSPRLPAARSALMLGAGVSAIAWMLSWREEREESLLRLGYAIGAGSDPQERIVVPFPRQAEDTPNGNGTRIRA